MTIGQVYQQLLTKLYQVYDIREAANIANMVLEHFTGKTKLDRILYKDIEVIAGQVAQIEDATEQLLSHKPVQYVLHEAWFAELKLYVDESVLIPRPETEELVEWIVEDNKHRIKSEQGKNTPPTIIDIGTGSGCIPISLKKNIPDAIVSAVDVSAEALAVAKQNAITHTAAINLQQLDFLHHSEWKKLDIYDIIVSNPPYIKQQEEAKMNKNVLLFEPHLALFVPDENALVFYEAIAAFGKDHLMKNGAIYMEINEALGQQVVKLFEREGYKQVVLKKDMQGKDRMVRASFT